MKKVWSNYVFIINRLFDNEYLISMHDNEYLISMHDINSYSCI